MKKIYRKPKLLKKGNMPSCKGACGTNQMCGELVRRFRQYEKKVNRSDDSRLYSSLRDVEKRRFRVTKNTDGD